MVLVTNQQFVPAVRCSTMADEYAHFRSPAELEAGVKIWQILSPFLLVFGTFGNVISILVLSKSQFNNWSSTVYLLGLAVADIFMLYIGLLRQWVKYTFDLDIRHTSSIVCKAHWFLMYVTADCAVWILTTITIERVVSTLYPYRSKRVCTKKVAKIMLVVIAATALLINGHLLFGFGRIEKHIGNKTTISCSPLTDAYAQFFGKIWTWIDLCKFSLIPFVILSSGNACIMYRLVVSRRKLKGDATVTLKRYKKTSNMSVLLVALNCMFILFTLPVSIYFIGEPYWVPRDIPRKVQLDDPWWAVVNILMYINNSVNFILYCASGSRFRNHVKKLLWFRQSKVSPSMMTSHAIGPVTNRHSTGLHM